jgi:hypothetical protein
MKRLDFLHGRAKPWQAVAILTVALLALTSAAVLPPVVQGRAASAPETQAIAAVRPLNAGAAAQLPITGTTQTPTRTAVPTATSTVVLAATNTATLAAIAAATATATNTLLPTATATATIISTNTPLPTTAVAPVAAQVVAAAPASAIGVAPVPPATVLQPYWTHVDPQYQYYNGPTSAYDNQWYAQRHINKPWLYQAFGYEPTAQCGTYYYQYQGRYYCYTGGSIAGQVPGGVIQPPPIGLVQTPTGYAQMSYWTNVDPQYQYYNGPAAAYENQWYAQRHIGNPWLYQPFASDPGAQCRTYHYQYQGSYYCFTGLSTYDAGDAAWSVPIRYWNHVDPQYQYYYGPTNAYENQWYAQRHINNPWLYQAFGYEPTAQCGTYYYRFQDAYFCYTGGSVGGQGPGGVIMPPDVGVVQTPAGYALTSYWAHVEPQYQYYNGPAAAYENQWYAQRHIGNPWLYQPFASDPGAQCRTYYYQYQDSYYCYTGLSVYDAGDTQWSVPIRYWANVDPQYQYYYGPDSPYDDAWYAQRHLGHPALYQPYDYAPSGECMTYHYQYQGRYYCYTGA